MEVTVIGDGKHALENALYKFSKLMKESGMFEELRKREQFTKKSVRLRQKRNKAQARRVADAKKAQRKKY